MFDGIFEAIEEWMRELLTGMVTSNLTTMFTDVNEKTGEIAAQVGQTPQGWNGSIFSLIQNLSNSVMAEEVQAAGAARGEGNPDYRTCTYPGEAGSGKD